MVAPKDVFILYFVDTDDPVFRCESFFEVVQRRSRGRDHLVSNTILTCTPAKEFREPIKRKLIHQAILHSTRCVFVNPVLPSRREETLFGYLVGPNSLRNPDHPEELVDIVAGISEKTAEDDKDVGDIVFDEDWVSHFFRAGHCFADGCDVGVVPSVVINHRRPISHPSDLIPIIPPTSDYIILTGIHPQPIICLSEIINEMVRSVWILAGKHNGRRRVRIGCDPGAVLNE